MALRAAADAAASARRAAAKRPARACGVACGAANCDDGPAPLAARAVSGRRLGRTSTAKANSGEHLARISPRVVIFDGPAAARLRRNVITRVAAITIRAEQTVHHHRVERREPEPRIGVDEPDSEAARPRPCAGASFGSVLRDTLGACITST